MDEQHQEQQQSGPTYEVVGYDDVRGVAVDAASTALESQRVRTDDEMQLVADSAAAKVSETVAGEVGKVTEEYLDKVADDASEGAAQAVLDGVGDELQGQADRLEAMLQQQLEAIDERSESLEAVTVTLDDAQWQYLQDAARTQTTVAMLQMLLVAMLLGAVCVRYFVDGWRR